MIFDLCGILDLRLQLCTHIELSVFLDKKLNVVLNFARVYGRKG